MKIVKNQKTNGSSVWALNSIEDCLVATLQPDINQQNLVQLEEEIKFILHNSNHRAFIIDASPLELIDTADFDHLRKVIDVAHLMGVETIFAGLNPGVAASLVELDANIDGLTTVLDMEKALVVANSWRGD